MQLNLKLGNNIFLQGNKVISYETHVANIEEDGIHCLGKYSMTTGKQIYKVAYKLNLDIHKSNVKQVFYKHEYGVKFSIDRCLSQKISEYIIGYMRENGLDYLRCSYDDIMSMLHNIPDVGPNDWAILRDYLGLPKDTPSPQEQEKQMKKAMDILFG
jgi:hypothetical protein